MTEQKHIGLEIRSIGSPDHELNSWNPSENSEVYFLIEMEIGQTGIDGADLFQVIVTTPEALKRKSGPEFSTISQRAMIVVSNYNWTKIQESINSIVKKCASSSWVDSVLSLQRYFEWEYENYKEETI